MRTRRSTITLSVVTLIGLLAACGGGSDPDLSPAEEARFETESDFAHCMRKEGLEEYPDPELATDGFMRVGVPLDQATGDVWDAAQDACQYIFRDASPEEEDGAGDGSEEEESAGDGNLYEEEVSGQALVDWVAKLTPGEPVDDAHCTGCTGG